MISSCSECDAVLQSPFPPRPADHAPDGMGTFAGELADELGIEADEITTTDVARAWARAFDWRETSDGWCCPAHVEKVS